jgi:two-component sensor histidine kinase
VGFATQALRARDFDRLLHEACAQVASGLGVPMAKLATIRPGGEGLLLRAQVGLPPDLAVPNETVLPIGTGSALGYAMQVGKPVISDVPNETRFEPSDLVRKSGVRISANVVIWIEGRPYGSLEADSIEEWRVSDADIDFLQTYASLVSAAIERAMLTDRVEALAQERQILLNEVFHRIKNLLANVLAIARRTVKHSGDLDEFQRAFEGRIGALSRAHDLLVTGAAKPARLRELLELEFSAKGLEPGKEFRIEGPEILCEPRTIQALALLVFELSTNAVKYGALSPNASSAAAIHVRWHTEESEKGTNLVLCWREFGVNHPVVGRRGFGSELLERLVPQMLGGVTRLKMHDDGIEYEITFRIQNEQRPATEPLRTAVQSRSEQYEVGH